MALWGAANPVIKTSSTTKKWTTRFLDMRRLHDYNDNEMKQKTPNPINRGHLMDNLMS
jgi:hypothetical protein